MLVYVWKSASLGVIRDLGFNLSNPNHQKLFRISNPNPAVNQSSQSSQSSRSSQSSQSSPPTDLKCSDVSYLSLLPPPPEPQQLLVLPGDEVDGGILQQSGKDKQETHGHPDIYSLHIGHLKTHTHTFILAVYPKDSRQISIAFT